MRSLSRMKLSQEAKEKLIIGIAPKAFEYMHATTANYFSIMMGKGFGEFIKDYVDSVENAFITEGEN